MIRQKHEPAFVAVLTLASSTGCCARTCAAGECELVAVAVDGAVVLDDRERERLDVGLGPEDRGGAREQVHETVVAEGVLVQVDKERLGRVAAVVRQVDAAPAVLLLLALQASEKGSQYRDTSASTQVSHAEGDTLLHT